MNTEQHFDRCWGCDRTYYYIRDVSGRRYSEIEPLPELAWQTVRLTPVRDTGAALDDEVLL
jgi:hypothetical protein